MSKTSRAYPIRRWVILAATFYLNLVVDGYCFIFGILTIHIQHTYPTVHPSVISLIGGITPALYNGLAPIGIALVERFGSRSVTIAGSLISTFGFVLCWMNETIFNAGFYFDFLTIGVIEGIAYALLYGPSINTIPTYFDHSTKSMAIGITTCGSAAGAILFGFLVHFLISAFGWRGTLLAFAIFALHGVVAAFSFPTPADLAKVRAQHSQNHHHHHHHHHEIKKKKGFFARYFDVSHFLQYSFLFVLAAAALSMAGYYVPVILIPGQSTHPEYNVSEIVQDNIILIWGTANLIGRLVTGWLGDYGRTHRNLGIFTSYSIYIIGHLVSSIALMIFPHVMTYGDAAFVTFVLVYGFFISPLITMRSVLVTDLYGEENSSSCFGWFLAVQGASQIFGYALPTFLDTLDSVWSYLFGALCFLGSAIFVAGTGWVYFRERRQRFSLISQLPLVDHELAEKQPFDLVKTNDTKEEKNGHLPISSPTNGHLPISSPTNGHLPTIRSPTNGAVIKTAHGYLTHNKSSDDSDAPASKSAESTTSTGSSSSSSSSSGSSSSINQTTAAEAKMIISNEADKK